MRKLFMLSIFSILMVSCGKNSSVWPTHDVEAASVEPATSEEFTYQFSGFRCNTGAQSSATFSGICEVLKDDELNQSCADDKREDLFLSANCVGSFK